MAPPSRQERLQMRQRGAGARQINNVDFGFSFGLTPTGAQRSGRKTPRPSNVTLRRTSKTPSQRGRQSSVARSVRSASATVENRGAGKIVTNETQEHASEGIEEPVAKRQRMQNDATPVTPADILRAASEVRSTSRASKSRRRTSGPAFVKIAEDPEVETTTANSGQEPILDDQTNQDAIVADLEQAGVDKENAGPEKVGADDGLAGARNHKRKPKKRRSIGQQSGRKRKRLSNESVQTVEEEPTHQSEGDANVAEDPEWETMIGDESSINPGERSESNKKPNTEQKKRKKRKSVVLKPKKRTRSGDDAQQTVLPSPERSAQVEADDSSALHTRVFAAGPTIRAKPKVSKRRRLSDASDIQKTGMKANRSRRTRVSDTPNIRTPGNVPAYDPETEDDETYVDEAESPEKPTPKRPSKKAPTKAKTLCRSGSSTERSLRRISDSSSRVKKPSKCTFPILTHRLTNVSALPTIAEEAENESDSPNNPNFIKAKFPERSAPNAIDVLAQICRETIQTTLSRLSVPDKAKSTKELRRKRFAIEAFGAELDSRLFDMSNAIEHRLTLEARVKKARKEKADLQAQWIEVRRQREEIALKCDDIRARHQENEAEGKEVYELSETLHGLEMVVERGEDIDETENGSGIEFMLKTVAGRVSSAGAGSGGMLDKIKRFNRQLERTACMLEGRGLD